MLLHLGADMLGLWLWARLGAKIGIAETILLPRLRLKVSGFRAYETLNPKPSHNPSTLWSSYPSPGPFNAGRDPQPRMCAR